MALLMLAVPWSPRKVVMGVSSCCWVLVVRGTTEPPVKFKSTLKLTWKSRGTPQSKQQHVPLAPPDNWAQVNCSSCHLQLCSSSGENLQDI